MGSFQVGNLTDGILGGSWDLVSTSFIAGLIALLVSGVSYS